MVGWWQKSGQKILRPDNMEQSEDKKALEGELLRVPNELVDRDKRLVKFAIMRVLRDLELGALSESDWEGVDKDVETVYKAFLEQEGKVGIRGLEGLGRMVDIPQM